MPRKKATNSKTKEAKVTKKGQAVQQKEGLSPLEILLAKGKKQKVKS